MARPDKHQRQAQRAREEIAANLARGRAAKAADAALALGPSERDAMMVQLAQAAAQDVERAFNTNDTDALFAWLGRVAREPRLLSGPPAAALRMRWVLFLAAMRAQQWPRAAAHWVELKSHVGNAVLAHAIEAYMQAQGQPAIEAIKRALEPEIDRLGYDEARPKLSHPAPKHVDEVETACFRCFGSEPWGRCYEIVTGWIAAAPQPVAHELRRTLVLLGRRELLERWDSPAALDVARIAAECAAKSGSPVESLPTVELALRVAARSLPQLRSDRRKAEACATIVEAALTHEGLQPLVEGAVLALDFEPPCLDVVLRMLGALMNRRPSVAAVFFTAKSLFGAVTNEIDTPVPATPEFWVAAVRDLLSTPKAFTGFLARLSPHTRSDAVLNLVHAASFDLGMELIDRLWADASEGIREALALAASRTIERQRFDLRPRNGRVDVKRFREMLTEAGEFETANVPDAALRSLLNSAEGQFMASALNFEAALAPLSGKPLDQWRSICERVMPYEVGLLELAIEHEPSTAKRKTLVTKFWSRRSTLRARAESWSEAGMNDHVLARKHLAKHLLDDLAPDSGDAAHALNDLFVHRAPSRLLERVSAALLDAIAREGTVAHTDEMLRALALAKRFKPGSTNKKPSKKKPKAVKKNRFSSEARGAILQNQLDLMPSEDDAAAISPRDRAP